MDKRFYLLKSGECVWVDYIADPRAETTEIYLPSDCVWIVPGTLDPDE